jgi:cell wall-associated NlpC family hydrolase
MAMSDIPTRSRVKKIASLRPGDMVFFGSRSAKSKPNENFHVGVSMGNGWVVHSSGGNGGVTIQKLDGWWGDSFSWGRRSLKVA